MTELTGNQENKFREKIKHVRFGMLTTVDPDRRLSSRPMTNQQIDAQGQLWFFTSDQAQFAKNLAAQPAVNVSFSAPEDSLYVSVSGHAELIKDRAKAEEMWSPFAAAWFPEGIDDPHLALIRIKVDFAEYWDSDSSKMTQLYKMAKAALTGAPPTDIGDHAKINF